MNKTVPGVLTYFDSGLWSNVIPQCGHADSAIRHALAALAAEHERSELAFLRYRKTSSPDRDAHEDAMRNFSLQQYNKAIMRLSLRMESDGQQTVKTTLICCLLFMCIESMKGNDRMMTGHIRNGLKIYHDWLDKSSISKDRIKGLTDPTSPECALAQVWRRLDHHATTFIDDHVPSQNVPVGIPPTPNQLAGLDFHTFEQARATLDLLMGRLFYFMRENSQYNTQPLELIPTSIREKHAAIGSQLLAYGLALSRFVTKFNTDSTIKGFRGVTILKMRQRALKIFHHKWPDEREPTEECEADFWAIASLGASLIQTNSAHELYVLPSSVRDSLAKLQLDPGSPTSLKLPTGSLPIFTLESGILPILYYTTQASHSSSIRQTAIELLRRANIREGLWWSMTTAVVAQQLLAEGDGKRRPMLAAKVQDLGKHLWDEVKRRKGSFPEYLAPEANV